MNSYYKVLIDDVDGKTCEVLCTSRERAFSLYHEYAQRENVCGISIFIVDAIKSAYSTIVLKVQR